MRKAQTEPKIEITLRSLDEHFTVMRLYIRNIGLGAARNVKFFPKVLSGGKVASDLMDNLTDANIFKVGLRYLGPGREFVSGYTNMTEDSEDKLNSMISIDVQYEGGMGKQYKENLIIDMSEFRGMRRIGGVPPLYSIARNLEKMQDDFHDMIKHSRRLSVDIYTENDRLREEEEMKKYIEENNAHKKSDK